MCLLADHILHIFLPLVLVAVAVPELRALEPGERLLPGISLPCVNFYICESVPTEFIDDVGDSDEFSVFCGVLVVFFGKQKELKAEQMF